MTEGICYVGFFGVVVPYMLLRVYNHRNAMGGSVSTSRESIAAE